jgi:hypothetical protein
MKTDILVHLWLYLAQFFLELEVTQIKLYRKSKHILCSITEGFPKIMTFMRYRGKILYSLAGHRWKYSVCVFHAGCLRLQTHTLRIRNIYWVSTVTMVARSVSILRYTYIAFLVTICQLAPSAKQFGTGSENRGKASHSNTLCFCNLCGSMSNCSPIMLLLLCALTFNFANTEKLWKIKKRRLC